MAYALLRRTSPSFRISSSTLDHPVAAPQLPSSSAYSPKYAILKLGGVRQMVEEGHDYTCLKRFLQEARAGSVSEAPSTSNTVIFHSVLGLREGGVFKWGKPFVADAAVEVEVLEEFPGPVPQHSPYHEVPESDIIMAKYRVKYISATASNSNSTVQQ